MKSKSLLAVFTCFFVISIVEFAYAQKSGRRSAPPPAPRKSSSPRSSGGKAPLGSISVANIKFKLDARTDDCPFLIQASDGLKFAGKVESELCGEAPIGWIGKRFSLTRSRQNFAVWKSELNESYKKCRGVTSAVLWNGEELERDRSHILLDFADGWVTLSVDLKKREQSISMTSAGVSSSGHPSWCWLQRGEPLARKKRLIEFLGQ